MILSILLSSLDVATHNGSFSADNAALKIGVSARSPQGLLTHSWTITSFDNQHILSLVRTFLNNLLPPAKMVSHLTPPQEPTHVYL